MVFFFASACTGYTQQSVSADRFAMQSEALAASVVNTPYSALIQVSSVETIDLPDPDKTDDYSEQKFIYHAKVIETFRGEAKKRISYAIYVEKGEAPDYPETQFIISLCKSDEAYYWPGTGALFSADSRLIHLARKFAQTTDGQQQTFEDCE